MTIEQMWLMQLAESKPDKPTVVEQEGLQILDEIIDDYLAGGASRIELLESLVSMADIVRNKLN